MLHRDAVSGGGYFMIGTVISADLDLIGQLQPHAPAPSRRSRWTKRSPRATSGRRCSPKCAKPCENQGRAPARPEGLNFNEEGDNQGPQAKETSGRSDHACRSCAACLETTQREMTLSLEKTARSSVFNLAHDYSTALFNAKPEMILQGQDIPIHLGSLIPAMKSVARFFGDDIHEGDLILHNDPAFGGSHAIDTCMYKPVFYKGKLVYWTVCKGHLTDIGGPVPAGYNPNAKEIYAECLRIPPVKIWDRGKPRNDVLNMIFTNMRARRDQEGDFNALDRRLPGRRAQSDRHARQVRRGDRRRLHRGTARHGRPPYARADQDRCRTEPTKASRCSRTPATASATSRSRRP